MKYKLILFSPGLLKSPDTIGFNHKTSRLLGSTRKYLGIEGCGQDKARNKKVHDSARLLILIMFYAEIPSLNPKP